jgi:parallel beta helix pectate lyase-like protein
MALSATTVLEVRSTGSDSNGGGFDSASSGTDYSQQNSAQVNIDNSTITTSITTNVITFVTGYTPSAADVGNVVNMLTGTNVNTGRYLITAVNVGAKTWTCDSALVSIGTTTNATAKMGGCYATPGAALADISIGGQTCWIKAATYQITGNIANSSIGPGGPFPRIIGYNTTRGDGGRATIQANATTFTMITLQKGSADGITLENIVVDGNSQTGVNGLSLSGALAMNCIIKNCTDAWAVNTGTAGSVLYNCEVGPNALTSTTANGTGAVLCQSSHILAIDRCYIHDNSTTATGIDVAGIMSPGGYTTVLNSIIYNNTGTLMHGVYGPSIIMNCAVHANGDNGIVVGLSHVSNNIITNNGGYGIYSGLASTTTNLFICNNAYYNNTSGPYHHINAGAGEVTLTGLPYVNAPTDFTLNNTAGQGLACKGAGSVGTIGLSSTVGTGYLDIGPLQRIGAAPQAGVATAFTFVS